jgi:glycosyltransferase involved in cell wall biosynthesis
VFTNCLINLYLFLPVYNRGRLTANFLEHIKPLIPECYLLRPIILEDCCTDNTVELAKLVCPDLHVIRLSGSHYWGGALNSIRDYIRSSRCKAGDNDIYMVCNDDVRFHPHSLAKALTLVKENLIVSALTVLVEDDFVSADSVHASSYDEHDVESMHYFDPSSGAFKPTANSSLVNICETRAMLTTAAPWLECLPIPVSIPHYLSDYWLTYDFSNKGFRIKHPIDFICYNSLITTQNTFGKDQQHFEIVGLNRGWFRERLRNYVLSCLSSVTKTSPSYAPAWITFLSAFSCQPNLPWILFKHRTQFVLGIILLSLKRSLATLKNIVRKSAFES